MTKALRFSRVYAPAVRLYFQISNGVEIVVPKRLQHHLICLHDTFLRFGWIEHLSANKLHVLHMIEHIW